MSSFISIWKIVIENNVRFCIESIVIIHNIPVTIVIRYKPVIINLYYEINYKREAKYFLCYNKAVGGVCCTRSRKMYIYR